MFCDAHFHLIPSINELFPESADKNAAGCPVEITSAFIEYFAEFYGCTCAHDKNEYIAQREVLQKLNADYGTHIKNHIYNSFGLHPQMPLIENADFLEKLLQNSELDAIGESGFDLFTPEFKQNIEKQKQAWQIQLELALQYKMPLVIHLRKSMEQIFSYSKELKKLPAVLFHSFPDNPQAALSLINHGINAYFSFGKQILNGNKKAIACVRQLPLKNLLLETDAPFQTLKDEDFTAPKEIERVYNAAYSIHIEENRNKCTFGEFCRSIQNNFSSLFYVNNK